jgi:serine/threonine protein kinase
MNRPSLQGSVFWMAPEVVKQTAHTSASDIWSVGCLVVEMLTGEHPWAQLTQMQAIFKVGGLFWLIALLWTFCADRSICETCYTIGYFLRGSGLPHEDF